VTKVFEFGGGKVCEHIGGIYDFLQSKKISELSELQKVQDTKTSQPSQKSLERQETSKNQSYAEHKEQQKLLRKAEKAVEESERKISDMESRLKELDDLLMIPEKAADMTLVTEYTSTKAMLDKEVERWEQLSEQLEQLLN
jgi:ATP-binding cassette subfamily F protein 3